MQLSELYLMEDWDWKKFARGAATGAALGAAGLVSGFGRGSSKPKPVEPPQQVRRHEPEPEPQPRLSKPIPKKELASKPEPKPKSTSGLYASFRQKLIDNEGFVTKANSVGKRGEIDIGVGHAMLNPNNGRTEAQQTAVSRRIFSKLFGNTVNFDVVLNGRQGLKSGQVEQLLKHDIDEHLDRAKHLFRKAGHFESLPQYLQEAILDGVYRGDIGTRATPKTIRLMNKNDWASAAKEYLDHDGYRDAAQKGIRGIRKRMEDNRDAMLKYAKELKQ